MKELAGRLIGYVFIGAFCAAGPLLLMLALGTAAQRAVLVMTGLRAEATVVGARASASGSTHATYAPVFQFTASNGRLYTVSSDVYDKESAIQFGERLRVLYRPGHPESARIDAFAPLWILPLVLGAVGGGFCIVPAIVLVSWMRRRADAAEPEKREAAHIRADAVSRGLRRALGMALIVAGGVFLATAIGLIPTGSSSNGAHVPATLLGVLLVACGVQVGRWAAEGGRLSFFLGGLVAAALAVLFGWVAVYGNAANFHGGISSGRVAIAASGPPSLARFLFGAVAILAGLASLWSWKQVFRSR